MNTTRQTVIFLPPLSPHRMEALPELTRSDKDGSDYSRLGIIVDPSNVISFDIVNTSGEILARLNVLNSSESGVQVDVIMNLSDNQPRKYKVQSWKYGERVLKQVIEGGLISVSLQKE